MYRYPTSQAAYSYTYISRDRKADEMSSFLAPFCHALLPSFDLRLQTSKLCLVKAFPWCHLSYFCSSPWAYVCLCCLFIKPQQPWQWFGAVLWVMLRYVWAPSPTFLFCMRLTRVLWKLFHPVELRLEEGSGRGREENHSRGSPLACEGRTGSSVR